MILPDRLDYYEETFLEGDMLESSPMVFCRVKGCNWGYLCGWSDLGDDGDVDWDKEHPAHG